MASSCCWTERLSSLAATPSFSRSSVSGRSNSTSCGSGSTTTSSSCRRSKIGGGKRSDSFYFSPLRDVEYLKSSSSFSLSSSPPPSRGAGVSCRAGLGKDLGEAARVAATGVTALGLSALLQLSPLDLGLGLAPTAAIANEATILNFPPGKEDFVVDDAAVLNRVTKSELKGILEELESKDGYHIDFVTLRKLTSKADAFEFADQVLERWYPTVEQGNNKGVVLLVTTQKEGAVTGGPAFVKAVGEPILEAIVAENLPVLATDEKYNEAFSSTAKRLVNAIRGLPDVGGPKFQENKRESNFKTKEETAEKRGQFSTVVGGLLVIAFVVPMAQYYAYVSRK